MSQGVLFLPVIPVVPVSSGTREQGSARPSFYKHHPIGHQLAIYRPGEFEKSFASWEFELGERVAGRLG